VYRGLSVAVVVPALNEERSIGLVVGDLVSLRDGGSAVVDDIVVCDPHRLLVNGRTELVGQTVRSPDIRAGMALIVAALCATRRPSVVQNAEIVDRGYEDIEGKLRALGARIERLED